MKLNLFRNLRVLKISIVCLVISSSLGAQETPSDSAAVSAVQALQTELANAYTTDGSRAVMRRIEALSQNSEELEALAQQISQSGESVIINVGAHQNESDAIRWINERFGRMD